MAPTMIWDGLRYIDIVTGIPYESFKSGITRPVYVPALDFSGARNVGTNPNIPLTPYTGPIETSGVARLTTAGLYENILFNTPIDIRNEVELKNCRVLVPATFAGATPIACVTVLNGGTATKNVKLTNTEIINRAQRPMNAFTGRNTRAEKCVTTGTIDGFSYSATGSAPADSRLEIIDSIIRELAWWYSPTINSLIHGSDTQSHSDGIQHNAVGEVYALNTAFYAYVDQFVGTGTPGSGSETNVWTPPTGYNFIANQAQMEAWRTEKANRFTLASKSPDGLAHRVPNAASFAGIMANLGNITADHCWFAGGNVQINAADSDLPQPPNIRLRNNTHYNDMTSGPGSRTTNPDVKGYAVMQLTGRTFDEFTGNVWSDGTPVSITRI